MSFDPETRSNSPNRRKGRVAEASAPLLSLQADRLEDMRGVLLDVGGVFIVPSRTRLAEALDHPVLGLSDAVFDRAHYEGMRALDTTKLPEPEERQAYLSGYISSLGIPEHELESAIDILGPIWSEPSPELWSRVLSESVSGLWTLSDADLLLGMVSNSDGHVERELMRNEICQIGLGPGVSVLAIVDSFVVGIAKPDPAIFGFALSALGLDPFEVVYVGDSVKYDVRSAETAGMTPLHFDPFDLCRDTDHAHVSSVAAVINHV